jgi:hypothetical protein
MNIKTLCAALLCVAFPMLHAEEAPLFRMTSNAVDAADSNQPGMVFQEVERSENASTVEAIETHGSVAAKSMFLLRGSCALMKERHKQAFRIEPLSKRPVRFVVRFVSPESPGSETPLQSMNEHSVISAARCSLFESIPGR